MKSCITCGMPFEGNHANDIGLETVDGPICKFDVQDGVIKSPEEIFEGGVEFFAGAVCDGDRELAAKVTRKNMKMLPYWQARPFAMLDGEMVSDEEFGALMAKMM